MLRGGDLGLFDKYLNELILPEVLISENLVSGFVYFLR